MWNQDADEVCAQHHFLLLPVAGSGRCDGGGEAGEQLDVLRGETEVYFGGAGSSEEAETAEGFR